MGGDEESRSSGVRKQPGMENGLKSREGGGGGGGVVGGRRRMRVWVGTGFVRL